MASYSVQNGSYRWSRRLLLTAASLLVVFIAGVVVVRYMYDTNLQPVSNSKEEKIVIVPRGALVPEIAAELKKSGLIRQEWAFERYVRNKSLGTRIQAGTYKFTPSHSVQEIVQQLAEGKVAVDLVTILPGQRLDQIRQAFIDAKFDAMAVDAALDPAQYRDSPALADKPASASLEGFLYAESYQKDATTDPKVIIRQSLREMETRLTPQIRAAFARQGLSVYQGVTLASIVEREVSAPGDRAQAAQVFHKRLKSDLPLQSDVTAIFGAVMDGQKPSVTYESLYNTYNHKGLPPGPISNVSESSLKAVAYPAATDWQYFVSGDDGKTYFSKTLEEHESLTKQYCRKLCGL